MNVQQRKAAEAQADRLCADAAETHAQATGHTVAVWPAAAPGPHGPGWGCTVCDPDLFGAQAVGVTKNTA